MTKFIEYIKSCKFHFLNLFFAYFVGIITCSIFMILWGFITLKYLLPVSEVIVLMILVMIFILFFSLPVLIFLCLILLCIKNQLEKYPEFVCFISLLLSIFVYLVINMLPFPNGFDISKFLSDGKNMYILTFFVIFTSASACFFYYRLKKYLKNLQPN